MHDKLVNKPLAEAIFELRWSLDEKKVQGLSVDPGFRFLVGRYYDRVKADYPNVVDLPTAQIPEELTGYTVRHQFRASKDGWPVTQLGPGIVTVNETSAYAWATFKPRLLSAVSALFESYPKEIAPCVPNEVMLRYLNAIPLPAEADTTSLGFLREYLHTAVSVESTLFENTTVAESPIGFNFGSSPKSVARSVLELSRRRRCGSCGKVVFPLFQAPVVKSSVAYCFFPPVRQLPQRLPAPDCPPVLASRRHGQSIGQR